MDNHDLRMNKSIMYKIISLGYSVYVDEWDNFVITRLICQDCGSKWNKSRTECFYCGNENYHIYVCAKCKTMYSITNASQKCGKGKCSGKLIKQCINPKCISNTNRKLQSYLEKKGGVFEIGKSGSTLNEMHCKKCGSFVSTYVSCEARFVDSEILDKLQEDNNVLYIHRNDINDISAYYNGKRFENMRVEDILANVFSQNAICVK